MKAEKIINWLEDWERLPLAIITMAGPWLTPLVPAYFVAVSIQNYLSAPLWVALISGAVLEVVGLAGIANATRAYMWNRTKRKSDEAAPLILSISAVSIYFVTALLLTVILEFRADLVPIAPGMFIVLSISSGLILVLSTMQRFREAEVKAEKERRKSGRQKRKTTAAQLPEKAAMITGTTRTQAAAILADHSAISGAELGRRLGKSERLGRMLKAEIVTNQNGKGQGGIIK